MELHSVLRGVVIILVLLVSALYVHRKRAEGPNQEVEHDDAVSALQELRQWGTFLIGIQSGALAIMGFLLEKIGTTGSKPIPLTEWEKTLGLTAIVFFAASIGVATWLLGALPSVLLRLKKERSTENDFYHLRLFSFKAWPYIGPLTGLQYALFLVGMMFFAAFTYMRLVRA